MRFHEEYRFFCTEKGLPLRGPLLELDDPPAIILRGNCSERFTDRLTDAEGAVIARSLMTCKTTACQQIDLSYNAVGDLTAEKLAEYIRICSSILHVALAFNEISAKGCRQLADAMIINSSLLTLDLEGNHVGEEGGVALATMLEANNQLKSLNLGSCGIKTGTLIGIAHALQLQPSLLTLNLDKPLLPGNQEGLSVATHMSEMLRRNTTLTELKLRRWRMNDEQLEQLSAGLAANSTLTSLDLSCNCFSSLSGAHLARVLRACPQLTSLDVGSNRLNDDGIIMIVEALGSSPCSMRRLDLRKTGVSARAVAAIAAFLPKCPTLQSLKLWGDEWVREPAAVRTLHSAKPSVDALSEVDFEFYFPRGEDTPQVVQR
eukprot:RCo018203